MIPSVLDKLVQSGLEAEAEKLEILDARQSSMSLKIPVMGGMKSGKSTLLARMFSSGEDFFPKDMVEATAKNVNIAWGPFAMRSYTKNDGAEISVADNSLWSRLVCGHSGETFASLDIQLPDELLGNGDVTFVDTPGNNTCDDYKVTETWKALVDSQAGIYCLKATALMENSDLVFLQEAKYYLSDFIFVITRMDEAGGKSVKSEVATSLVSAAKKKLEEFHIHPLAVLPISAQAENIEDSGIPELRTCIRNIAREQGVVLRNHQVFLQGTRILESSRTDLNNDLSIARKAAATTKEQFTEQKALLQSKLVDLNAEMENSIRRLEKKIESLKIGSTKKISLFSDTAVKRIEERLSEMRTYLQIKESGDAVVRSEIDKWRQDVQNYLVQLPNEISEAQVQTSQDFVKQLHDSVETTMNVNLQIRLADVNEELSVKTYADEYLREISLQREEILGEIDSLQEEIRASDEELPELVSKLAEAKAAVQSLHYEPVYDRVERKKTGSAATVLKTLGNIADIGMIFLPTGWISALGKAGVAGSKLPKIAKIVKTGSRMSGVGKVISKTGPQTKGKGTNPLEFLSLEFWGEKIGNVIDGRSGDEPEFEMMENQEVLGDYLRKKNELEFICSQSQTEYLRLERVRNEKQRVLDLLKQQNMELSAEYKQAEEDVLTAQKEMREVFERQELALWRKKVLSGISKLFYSTQSDLMQPVTTALENYFKECTARSKQELQDRLSATIKQVEEQLSDRDLAFSQEKSVCEKNLSTIVERIKCIEEILNFSEDMWFTAG